MDIRQQVFFIGGSDPVARKKIFDDLRIKLAAGANDGPVFSYYADTIEIARFAEEVLNFSLGHGALIVFKDAHHLDAETQKFLKDNLARIVACGNVIFESDEPLEGLRGRSDKAGFFDFIFKNSTVLRGTMLPPRPTMENFSESVRSNDLAGAIYIMDKLLDEKGAQAVPPFILGIMTSRAAYGNDSALKKQQLTCLWEADRQLKEKGHEPRLVLEILLTKMMRFVRG